MGTEENVNFDDSVKLHLTQIGCILVIAFLCSITWGAFILALGI